MHGALVNNQKGCWQSIEPEKREKEKYTNDDIHLLKRKMKTILTIAGSDTSAGAGIQQDLKTITALGNYALTVPTALTAQNTLGVKSIMAVPDEVLEAQLDAIFEDFHVDAVKIGMIPQLSSAKIIVEKLSSLHVPIVCDPVMVSTSGTSLMSNECRLFVANNLFPLCSLVTPNIPEAYYLAGISTRERVLASSNNSEGSVKEKETEMIGRELSALYKTSLLVKGGHRNDDIMLDTLYMPDGKEFSFTSNRIETGNLHGTGCTLSSAIACFLAEKNSLPEAIKKSKNIINIGIKNARNMKLGHGNGPLWIPCLIKN